MKTLPDLPRKNKRLEAKFDGLVGDWLDKNWPHPYVCEVKITGGKLKPHQKVFMERVANGKQKHWKIADMGRENKCDIVGGFRYMDPLVCTVDSETRKVTCEMYNGNYEFTFKV